VLSGNLTAESVCWTDQAIVAPDPSLSEVANA